MHGMNWTAMRDKYMELVGRVHDREELNDLIAQMVSELSLLHTFVRGGDIRRGTDQIQPASLGARLARDPARAAMLSRTSTNPIPIVPTSWGRCLVPAWILPKAT